MFEYYIYFREKPGKDSDLCFGGVALKSPVQLDRGRVLQLPPCAALFPEKNPSEFPEYLKNTGLWIVDEAIDKHHLSKIPATTPAEKDAQITEYSSTTIRVVPYKR